MLVFSDKLSLPGPDAMIGDVMSLGAGMFWAATDAGHQADRGWPTASAEKLLLYQLVGLRRRWRCRCCSLPARCSATSRAVPVAALLFQAVYVVAFTYVLWFWLMRRYPAAGLSSFTFLTPAFGVLCGGLLLGEPLSIGIFPGAWR